MLYYAIKRSGVPGRKLYADRGRAEAAMMKAAVEDAERATQTWRRNTENLSGVYPDMKSVTYSAVKTKDGCDVVLNERKFTVTSYAIAIFETEDESENQ